MRIFLFGVLFFVSIFTAEYGSSQEAQEAQESRLLPKRVEADSDFDGKPDRFEYYDPDGNIDRVESDSNADGVIDERILYRDGKPVKGERDSNADGKPDIWIEY